MISTEQKDELIARIIDKFLTEPMSHISQKAVIDGAILLGVNDRQLIIYLKSKVEPFMNGQKAAKSPITTVFSVLALVQGCYEKLKQVGAAEERQAELVDGEMNLNEQYKTLFYMVHWLCKNPNQLFSKAEQIALLTHLTRALSELSKVVEYSVLVKLLDDREAMDTIDIDFICFQNKQLNEHRIKSMQRIIGRLDLAAEKTDAAKQAARELIKLMQGTCKHEEVVMTWLVEHKIDQLQGRESNIEDPHRKKLTQLCDRDQSLWLSQVNKSIDNYLSTKS